MESNKYRNNTSFIDLLFCILLGFVFLFMVAFLMMNPPQTKSIDPQAEFLVIMSWPDNNTADVDLWVGKPNNVSVNFYAKQDGLVHLDRDDMGMINDYIQGPEGKIINPINREVVSIRGKPPGNYIVNIHLYNTHGAVEPVPVTVEFIKVTPYTVITSREVTIVNNGEEQTMFTFSMMKDGKIKNIGHEYRSLVDGKWDE